jgi:membrane protease YdiL (CAAX protease family)
MNPENPFFTLKTRGLIAWMLGGFVGFVVFLGIFEAFRPIDKGLAENLIGLFIYLWMWLWVCRKVRRNGIQLARFFRKGDRVGIVGLTGLVLVLIVFAIGAILLFDFALAHVSPRILAWLKQPDPPASPNRVVRNVNLLLDSLTLVLLAPVLEELVFRGFLLNRWAAKWGVRTAAWLSAVAFAVPHTRDPIGAFVFGLCMSLLYVKTRALWPSITAHSLNNTVALAFKLFYGREKATHAVVSLDSYKSFPLLGLVLLVLAAPFLIAFIYRNWPSRNEALPYQPEPKADALSELVAAPERQVDKLEACPTSDGAEPSLAGSDSAERGKYGEFPD